MTAVQPIHHEFSSTFPQISEQENTTNHVSMSPRVEKLDQNPKVMPRNRFLTGYVMLLVVVAGLLFGAYLYTQQSKETKSEVQLTVQKMLQPQTQPSLNQNGKIKQVPNSDSKHGSSASAQSSSTSASAKGKSPPVQKPFKPTNPSSNNNRREDDDERRDDEQRRRRAAMNNKGANNIEPTNDDEEDEESEQEVNLWVDTRPVSGGNTVAPNVGNTRN